ncbi:MAG: restriction endonuclease subunit S [Firmicutes bacterium]|nr:restriction endonuclease subunit S [Bacillota bacterium]
MQKVKLEDVCTIVTGTTPKTGIQEYWDGQLNWITPAEINEKDIIIKESVRKITEIAVAKSNLKAFPEGTVILSTRAPIGKVAIAGCEMYCNQGLKNLICSEKLNNYYLYWFLKSKKDYLNSLGRGATFKEISKSIVGSIKIPLPEFDRQKRIAGVLAKCWDNLQLRQRQISEIDLLVKSRFVEGLGCATTWGTMHHCKRWFTKTY